MLACVASKHSKSTRNEVPWEVMRGLPTQEWMHVYVVGTKARGYTVTRKTVPGAGPKSLFNGNSATSIWVYFLFIPMLCSLVCCSFGAETVLPALGSFSFHNHNLIVIADLGLKQYYLHWGRFLFITKNCYCSFGAETVLPALGSFSFHNHNFIVIAVLGLKQYYLHWGRFLLRTTIWLLLQFWRWNSATCNGVNILDIHRTCGVVNCFVLELYHCFCRFY